MEKQKITIELTWDESQERYKQWKKRARLTKANTLEHLRDFDKRAYLKGIKLGKILKEG